MTAKKTQDYRSSTEKECFICHVVKPIDEFYKHSQMGDGHLNKCKQCNKEQSKQRHYDKYLNDPSFIESERRRGREKYRRLGYCEKQKENDKDKPWKQDSFYKGLHKKLKTRGLLSENENAHHWNYNRLNDFFILNKSDHKFIHTKIKIDMGSFLFKDNDTDNILYNSEDHVDLLEGYGIEYRHVIL